MGFGKLLANCFAWCVCGRGSGRKKSKKSPQKSRPKSPQALEVLHSVNEIQESSEDDLTFTEKAIRERESDNDSISVVISLSDCNSSSISGASTTISVEYSWPEDIFSSLEDENSNSESDLAETSTEVIRAHVPSGEIVPIIGQIGMDRDGHHGSGSSRDSYSLEIEFSIENISNTSPEDNWTWDCCNSSIDSYTEEIVEPLEPGRNLFIPSAFRGPSGPGDNTPKSILATTKYHVWMKKQKFPLPYISRFTEEKLNFKIRFLRTYDKNRLKSTDINIWQILYKVPMYRDYNTKVPGPGRLNNRFLKWERPVFN